MLPLSRDSVQVAPANVRSNPSDRIALTIEYDGSAFSGWQKQKSSALNTVQEILETALTRVADQPIAVICAGRTDAGVHATAQVVHFDCRKPRGKKAWIQGVNSILPRGVRVVAATPVEETFHARFSAEYRRYCYLISSAPVASGIFHGKVTCLKRPLDTQAMHRAAQRLVGERDFSAFRAAGCQSASANRNVQAVSVVDWFGITVIDIRANAFLQHMVRNISGSLIDVGSGKQKEAWIGEILESKDRRRAGVTAPPDGLYLVEIGYHDSALSGNEPRFPLLLAGYE